MKNQRKARVRGNARIARNRARVGEEAQRPARGRASPALGLPGARCSAAQRFAPGMNDAGRCAKTKECVEGGLIQPGVMAAPSRSPWSWPRPNSASNIKGKDWAKLDRQALGGGPAA